VAVLSARSFRYFLGAVPLVDEPEIGADEEQDAVPLRILSMRWKLISVFINRFYAVRAQVVVFCLFLLAFLQSIVAFELEFGACFFSRNHGVTML